MRWQASRTRAVAWLGFWSLMAISCGRNPLDWTPRVPLDAGDTLPDTARPAPDAPSDRPADARDAGPDVSPDFRPDLGSDVPVDRPPPPTDVRDVAESRPDVPPDMARPPIDAACAVDCSHLPNVRPDVFVECRAGQCVLPPGACRAGFAHCSFNPNDGCEADLSSSSSCGGCYRICEGFYSSCNPFGDTYVCGPRCAPPYPDTCGFSCSNLSSDVNNCGTCGNWCYSPNATNECRQGKCVVLGCISPHFADCTADPGCETVLGTETDCSACGDKACTLANTLRSCSNGGTCDAAVCMPGFANCDTTSADCEATFSAGATCLPQYLGTFPVATQSFDSSVAAIAPDGSYLLAGIFTGSVDFDPGAGQDVRTAPNDADGFITKLNADGTYAWTRTLTGRGDTIVLAGLTTTASGAVIATGWYSDTIDLDPGTTSDVHFTTTPYQWDPFVVKLAADGSFVWGRTFVGSNGASGTATSVAADAAESVYVTGSFLGEMDFDPGAGTTFLTASQTNAMVVKLTAAGTFGWVRNFDNVDCSVSMDSVTVASDGSVWGAGRSESGSGCPRTALPDGSRQDDILIAKFGPTGDARGSWIIASNDEEYASAMTAGKDGAVYVGGAASGLVDFDPGPGTAMRWVGQALSGFVLKLDATGGFRWMRSLADIAVVSLAGTADGGVIAGGATAGALVTRLTADGGSVWTFTGGGDGANMRAVAAGATTFAIAGMSSGSADFNPGPGVDIVYGEITFLSRFRF